jgi:glyoxylase-like metal-dependent hydrolase (beta-lactamase superfamily II)
MRGLERIGEHVLWLAPGPPDRPSLCAVVGDRSRMMLDAGSSAAHAQLVLDRLSVPPSHVALTHSHWDHVFGAAEVGAPVIAHSLTAATLQELAVTDWSDEALDRRVAAGEDSPQHAANVKEELPSPREVQVAQADLVFQDGIDVELGGATVRIRHVGGDHAVDSCVMYVEPDRVLFLGDCLYDSPDGRLTPERVFPLYDTVFGFGAELFVEGHSETVIPLVELEELAAKVRHAHELVEAGATPPGEPDEDLAFFVGAFSAGRAG